MNIITARSIELVKAQASLGLTVAVFCPEDREEWYKKVYREFPTVIVNPRPEPRPLINLIWIDEASECDQSTWDALTANMERKAGLKP